jgi:hypothetical protein
MLRFSERVAICRAQALAGCSASPVPLRSTAVAAVRERLRRVASVSRPASIFKASRLVTLCVKIRVRVRFRVRVS